MTTSGKAPEPSEDEHDETSGTIAESTAERLERAGRELAPDETSWRPILFDGRDSDGALRALLDSGRVRAVHDTLLGQLEELVETRRAERPPRGPERRALALAHLGGAPLHEYGTWVFHSWSGRLVHVLPEAELRELRTSRNRNKITSEEQHRLAGARIGVAGLSVGQATAITAALEGIAGELRLADFDRLSLSNLNRLRAPLSSIGVNKAVITAREIAEIDPYLRVRIFEDGLHEGNLEEFLLGGGPLSILFEECDDLRMKVRLRELARAHRIPVLMETSDRGLFDVERFDEEPGRPIFHGLTGELRADELEGRTSYEKVPVVLSIIGAETMSPRMAASLVDIDATLRTWPQLASAVALGGAINTDVARRVLLGQHHGSGRYYVDLESAIAPGRGSFARAVRVPPVPAAARAVVPEAPEPIPPLAPARWPLSADDVRCLVAHATLAPSGGNCQPWRIERHGAELRCFLDRARARSFLDYRDRASALALGALAENLALAARAIGLEAAIEPFPDPTDRDLFCVARLAPARQTASDLDLDLAGAITLRVTNRRRAAAAPLDEEERSALLTIVRDAGARLSLLESEEARAEIGAIVGAAERIRLLSERMHREMMSELRWTRAAALRTRDGLDVETLELDPTERAGMAILSRWPVMRTMAALGGGAGLASPSRKAIAASAAVGLVTVEGGALADYLRAGRAFERVWLHATRRELAIQPMTASVYMFARLEDGADGFSERERRELEALRARWRALWGEHGGAEAMLFRVSRAGPPTRRALRRRVDDVLRDDASALAAE